METAISTLRLARERFERRIAECKARIEREKAMVEAYEAGLTALIAVEMALPANPAVEPCEMEPIAVPVSRRHASTEAPSQVKRTSTASGHRPLSSKTPAPVATPEEFRGSNPVDIGDGRRTLAEGSNFAGCVEALRMRSPHWVTPAGIVEIARQGRKDAPQHFDTVIAGEMAKQRKLRAFVVPGLQARQVDGRWQYRIAAAAEGDQ